MHRSLEWARYLGALLPKRMIASWSGSPADPTEYKYAAQGIAPNGRLPRFVSLSFTPLGLTAATSIKGPVDQKKGCHDAHC